MECNECHCVKYINIKSFYLSLSVNNWKNKKGENTKYTMNEAISKFFAAEQIEMNYPECKKKLLGTKPNV